MLVPVLWIPSTSVSISRHIRTISTTLVVLQSRLLFGFVSESKRMWYWIRSLPPAFDKRSLSVLNAHLKSSSQVLQAALRGVAATRAILAQLQASAPSFLRAHVRGTIDAVLEAMNDIADAVTDTPDDKHQINPEECGDKGGDGGSPPRANWPCGRERRTCRRARRLQLCVRAARRSLELGGAQGPEMEAVAREALANAGCIFTTLSSAGQQLVRSSVPVDVLVVDEAAQVSVFLL